MTDRAPDISITRTFNASPRSVFEAWTDPTAFGRWFGTEATVVKDVTMDLRVGGAWSAGWSSETARRSVGMVRISTEAPHRLVLSLSDRPGNQFERVTVDLKEIDGGTEMTFTQTGGNMPPENYAQAEAGWRSFFDDLSKGLSG